ncbi:MAG: hypothetical protein HRU19_30350 [Pseudobacteriovorax sp.]|nr:hypothetical protein [Pseudobacteriovorax sp.]
MHFLLSEIETILSPLEAKLRRLQANAYCDQAEVAELESEIAALTVFDPSSEGFLREVPMTLYRDKSKALLEKSSVEAALFEQTTNECYKKLQEGIQKGNSRGDKPLPSGLIRNLNALCYFEFMESDFFFQLSNMASFRTTPSY